MAEARCCGPAAQLSAHAATRESRERGDEMLRRCIVQQVTVRSEQLSLPHFRLLSSALVRTPSLPPSSSLSFTLSLSLSRSRFLSLSLSPSDITQNPPPCVDETGYLQGGDGPGESSRESAQARGRREAVRTVFRRRAHVARGARSGLQRHQDKHLYELLRGVPNRRVPESQCGR